MATSVLKATSPVARRSTYRPRQYVVNCPVCHRWSPVPTLHVQAICREAGCCLDCMKDAYFMLKVRIAAIEMVLESIIKRGKQLPEDQRQALREVYARKAQQLADCRERLVRLEESREQHKRLAEAMA